MRFVLPSLPSSVTTLLGDRLGRPEHVDPRLRVRLDRRAGLRRQRVLQRPQHRARRTWQPTPPAGIANSGLSAGATRTASVGLAGGGRLQPSIAWASEAELDPVTSFTRPVLGLRRVADPDHLRAVDLLRARRRELLERLLAGRRQLAAVGEQHGGAQRARHQLGGRDRRAPVVLLDDHDRARAALVRAGGVDRAGDAGGVGDRVGARHARRVLRREDREAERGRVVGLLLVAAGAEDRLALSRALVAAVVVAAAAAGDAERAEGKAGSASNHRYKASVTLRDAVHGGIALKFGQRKPTNHWT